jgi:hypothetical protein
MNTRSILQIVIFFVVFTAFQWLVTRNLNLGGIAFSFNYIGAILLLPIQFNPLIALVMAFALGLVTDSFYDTPGMHVFASVLTAWLRVWNAKILTPAGGYDEYNAVNMASMGIRWYLLFMLPLLFLHCLCLFIIEYASMADIGIILIKSLSSAVFTFFVIVIIQLMLQSSGRLR